jgi:hypothetical protein
MHDPISDLPPAMSPISQPPLPQLGLDEFISDEQLDVLIDRGEAMRTGSIVRSCAGAMYVLHEAVRVIGRVNQETDPYGFIGVVDTVGGMLKRGFVMSAERIALGRAVYDAEYGYIVEPVGNGSADASGVNPKIG